MPTWKEVIQDKDYQSLPLGERIKTKNEFFRNVISRSNKFINLPSEKQSQIRTQFFTPRPQEKIEPIFPEQKTIGNVLRYAHEEFTQRSPFKYLDQPVEEVAKFIEPDTAQEGAMGMLKFIPRQMVAEVLRAYKPSTVGAFGVGMKIAKPLLKPILKPVGKFIASKIPESVKKLALKNLTIGKGQPQAYVGMAKETQLERAVGAREAEEVSRILSTKPTGQVLTLEEQRYVGRIFRKEVIESPVLKIHPKYQELKSISDQGRAIMDKWSTELAQSGIPKKVAQETIEANIGQYMPRMYSTKMQPIESKLGFFKQLRLRLGMLKHRKDLSSEVRNLMGEIKEPALPTAIRVKQISANIANNKLFTKVSQNPDWVSKEAVNGWMKMPDTETVGLLRGKWVNPEIGEDINALVKANEQAVGLYSKMLSAWKFGKVALNPAAQARNLISNTILLDLSGTSHLRQAQLFPGAFKEYMTKGKIYQQALNDGAIGGEFVGTETMQKLRDFYIGTKGNNLQKWIGIAKMPFRKAGELYQGMEQLSKMVKYMDVLEKTHNNKLAAQEAQKWLFNYNEIPKFIDWARKSPLGAPFIAFTYKAIPRLAETLVNRPMALYKYYALATAFNETSRKYQGMSLVDFARQKKLLPSRLSRDIGGMPTNLLLPYQDKHKRTQWLNLEYILPFGMAPEIMQKGLIRGAMGNPLFTLYSELKSNTDFSGKPIIPPEASKVEAIQAVISHIYRQLAPSLAPSIPPITKGGYSFEKIMDAIAQKPDFMDRTRELTPTLLDTLAGIKINPLDVEESEMFSIINKKNRIETLEKELLKLEHPAISEKERDRKTETIFKKIQTIVDSL